MEGFEAVNRQAIAERMNDENISNIIIQSIGQPVPYEEGSPYYRYESANETYLWVNSPLRRGFEPVNWRVINPSEAQAMEDALKRNFCDNVDGPLDPETFLRLHLILKQGAYRRMFYSDIVNAEWPWENPGPGGWKWWSTKEGREGRKTIRRKFKFYTLLFGLAWLVSMLRDFTWAFLLLPKLIDLLNGHFGARAASQVAKKQASSSSSS